MRNLRAYYAASLTDFLRQPAEEILGIIHANNISAETTIQQANTWQQEIDILKKQLHAFHEGRILLEYTIPRMGKRVDAVVLHDHIVFLLEFKCGEREYLHGAYNQVLDYALDLRNFQKESHDKLIVPLVISTLAPRADDPIVECERIIMPLRCNSETIGETIATVAQQYPHEAPFDYQAWENAQYLPTPTIVEAAQALYRGHNVHEITRSDAGAENLTVTTETINEIVDYSKANGRKSICFVTGVPGAGKTLVGLNIAIERSDAEQGQHAVFLSGNFPLVTVLQEALARDKLSQCKESGISMTKADALRSTSAFIQIIHKYRDSFVGNAHVPPEHIVIFDEAQRAWTQDMIAKFMRTKKGVPEFSYSEPEFLISTMDRHEDWAVIICLVGGGQEINTGEAGLPEWFDSLRRSFGDWDVYVTPELNDTEYRRERNWDELTSGLHLFERRQLHLATSVRSFRTPDLAAFVKALLDVDRESARSLYASIADKYPIVLTRSLATAKRWVKEHCLGTTRYGMMASSGGLRLKPEGIFVKNEVSVANWFLNDAEDVRSSYALEDVVTDFDIQGLEIDYALVAWDADFRFDGENWAYFNFVGNRWTTVHAEEKQRYLKNTYRVLLTRARQGMAIFIPRGNPEDHTRVPEFYDRTYDYLKGLGIETI